MKYLHILFASIFLCFTMQTLDAMMKRKFERTEKGKEKEKEKEKEVEYTPEEKRLKISQEIETDQIKKQRLIEQSAQKFIKAFLAAQDEQEIKKLKDQYENSIPKMKQYIVRLVNQPNSAGETLLHQARTPQEVHGLLFLSANPLIKNRLRQVPLATIITHGNVQAAEALIEVQSNALDNSEFVKTLNNDNYAQLSQFTPLHYAVAYNTPSLVKKFLEHTTYTSNIKHNINDLLEDVTNDGDEDELDIADKQTLLTLAAQYSLESIPLLLQLGADINKPDERDRTPIMFVAGNPNAQPRDIDFMVKSGADIHAKDDYNNNLIVYAVKENNDAIIQHLVEKYKLDPNKRNNDRDEDGVFENGRLPIDYAIEQFKEKSDEEKQIDTIRILLNFGSELPSNAREILYPTAFVYRDADGSLRADVLKLLIDHGASINAFDDKGYTLANVIFDNYDFSKIINTIKPAEELYYDLIKFLIEEGAKLTHDDKEIILQSEGYERLKKLVEKTQVIDLKQ